MFRFPFVTVQVACLTLGWILWVTIPDSPMPGLEWRFHFGGAQFIFGTMFGVGIGLYLSRSRDARALHK